MTVEQTSYGDRARKPSTRGESAEPSGGLLGEVAAVAGFKLIINPEPCVCTECLDTKLVQVPCLSCCQDEAVEEIKEQLDFYAEWDRETAS